jgi:hypothetical protein
MSHTSINLFEMETGLFIKSEYPSNSGSISLINKDRTTEICLFLPLEQWWQVRHAFPKTDYFYTYTVSHAGDDRISDHTKADLAAKAYFNQQSETAA